MLSSKRKPLSSAGLRQFLRKALDKGWVRELPHSDVDRAYRNISDDDIQHGLELSGWVIEKTEPAREAGLFKYTIRTADIEGDELHLVILPFTSSGTVEIITKY
jgi:hypothetical protein